MQQAFAKYLPALLSALFGVSAVLFWVFPHISLLLYQEQYQLFVFTTGYFVERIVLPGGLADYVAEFCTQFNYVYVVGAMLVAAWLTGLQLLVWQLCRRHGAAAVWYPLSFVPALLVWCAMSDENVMLSFVVALDLNLLLMLAWRRVADARGPWPMPCCVAAIALAYWLTGPAAMALAAYVAVGELKRRRPMAAVAAVLAVATAVLLSYRLLHYPLARLVVGLNYYRYPVGMPAFMCLMLMLLALMPWLVAALPQWRGRIAMPLLAVLTFAAGCGSLSVLYGGLRHDLIEYDYLVRTHNWDAIVAKGKTQPDPTPMSVSCVNLALSRKGMLADCLFDFYQNGAEGLLPTFTRDMLSPVSTAEIFYYLGFVNDSERYMFEAQQAVPNFRLSARLTKRIVDCEIVNGNYGVARKHLQQLRNSLFYSDWAESRLAMLGNEQAIDAHPEYGRLRRIRQQKTDFLFSDSEMDQMLGLLFAGNMDNRMAYEYLMCHVLLRRDLEKFGQYYPLGQYAGYDHIPRAFQQVLVGQWLREHSDLSSMPYSVSAANVSSTVEFIRTYMADRRSPSLQRPPLSTNAWHYLLAESDTN